MMIHVYDAVAVLCEFIDQVVVDILRVYPSLKPHISFYSDHLATWHSFTDITHGY